MVSMIENWADVSGTIIGVSPTTEGSVLKVRVKSVAATDNFPNLLRAEPGEEISIIVRPGQVESGAEAVGKTVMIRARRGGPDRIYAHPDWKIGTGG